MNKEANCKSIEKLVNEFFEKFSIGQLPDSMAPKAFLFGKSQEDFLKGLEDKVLGIPKLGRALSAQDQDNLAVRVFDSDEKLRLVNNAGEEVGKLVSIERCFVITLVDIPNNGKKISNVDCYIKHKDKPGELDSKEYIVCDPDYCPPKCQRCG